MEGRNDLVGSNESPTPRVSSLERKTGETNITVTVNLDGQGFFEVDTGNGFLDHMVSQIARHGLFDLSLIHI